jgi:hypothetical protein
MGTVSCHNGLSVNGARSSKMVTQALSMGKELDANPHPLLMQTDTAHTVENLKKLNFEILKHPLYSLDLTPSDSPVWSSALVFLNMKHTVRIIIDSPSYIRFYFLINVYMVLFPFDSAIYVFLLHDYVFSLYVYV